MRKRDNIIQGYLVEMAKNMGVVTAIVYDKCEFWGNRGTRADGWVYKTYDEMYDETGLKVDAVRAAYRRLSNEGLIEIKTMKVGGTPKLHFRLLEFPLSEIQFSIENGNSNSPIYTEPTQNQPESLVSDLAQDPDNSRRVVENTSLLEELIGIINPREKPTQERLRMLNARRKDYTRKEIVDSAKAFSKSKWHRDNKQMSIDNLLAPSKFGRWFAKKDDQVALEQSDEDSSYYDGVKVTPQNQSEILKKWKERHEN